MLRPMMLGVTLLSAALLTGSAGAQVAGGRAGNRSDWQVEAAGWIRDTFFRTIGEHPTYGHGYTIVSGKSNSSPDNRVLFVRLRLRALRANPAAVSAWKSALPPYWNSLFYIGPRPCEPVAGDYRPFDSNDVLLKSHRPAIVVTLAEQMIGGADTKLGKATLAFPTPPAGLVCSIGIDGGERLIGLVRLGSETNVTVAFKVSKDFLIRSAKLEVFGIPVPLTETAGEDLNDAALRLDWVTALISK